ncbi:MAG: hypothetical protein KY476_06500, partial [Planctomycetes bacterium]|nr:hypothetical protein [Planctomycetota bacterium]
NGPDGEQDGSPIPRNTTLRKQHQAIPPSAISLMDNQAASSGGAEIHKALVQNAIRAKRLRRTYFDAQCVSGPPGERHELVSTRLSCAASYRKRCPYRGRKHMACLDELSVERVWQAFVRVAERTSTIHRAA